MHFINWFLQFFRLQFAKELNVKKNALKLKLSFKHPIQPRKMPPIQQLPITFLLNDPTTPDLQELVPLPPTMPKLRYFVEGFRGGGFDLSSKEGRAAHVYVVVNNFINMIQSHMPIPLEKWAATTNLTIRPHAGNKLNASYNRFSIQLYIGKHPTTNDLVYTCLSTEVVCHELGHAILDAIRKDLWNSPFFEVWAFHEAFADFISMMNALQYNKIVDRILQETSGDLKRPSIFAKIAEHLAETAYAISQEGSPDFLRNAVNHFTYIDPTSLPENSAKDQLSLDPHNFGRIMLGSLYDCFVEIYAFERSNGITNGDAIRNAHNRILKYLFIAITQTPVSSRFFESFAKTMLWTAKSYDDGLFYATFNNIFTRRNLISDIKMMAMGDSQELGNPGIAPRIEKHNNPLTTLASECIFSTQGTNIEDFEMDSTTQDAKFVDENNVVIEELYNRREDVINALQLTLGFLEKNTTGFVVENRKLIRNYIMCCREKRKSSPEYLKPPKPHLNSGCCGGCRDTTSQEKSKKKIKRGCVIRHKAC